MSGNGSPDASRQAPIAAIVVTHNRREQLSRCIDSIRWQSHPVDFIIVVDNASRDDTASYLTAQKRVSAIRLTHNVGGAGGFSVGMRRGIDSGATWLWLLDDDCIPDMSCLERLMRAASDCAEPQVGAVSPSVGATPEDAVFGFLRNPSRTLRTEAQASPMAAVDITQIDWAAFAGLLIRADACASTGPVRDDFVIWNDDTEYCLRMRLQGWTLLGVPSAFVWHAARPRIKARVLGHELSVRQVEPRFEFYGVRNLVYVDWLYRHGALRDGRSMAWRVTHEIVSACKVLIIDRECGVARAQARLHGLAVALLTLAGRRERFSNCPLRIGHGASRRQTLPRYWRARA